MILAVSSPLRVLPISGETASCICVCSIPAGHLPVVSSTELHSDRLYFLFEGLSSQTNKRNNPAQIYVIGR